MLAEEMSGLSRLGLTVDQQQKIARTGMPTAPRITPRITELLDAHADCEIGMCFTCTHVWTGKKLIVSTVERPSRIKGTFYVPQRVFCPRCENMSLETLVLSHLLTCPPGQPAIQEAPVTESKADAKITDYSQDPQNANQGTERGAEMVENECEHRFKYVGIRFRKMQGHFEYYDFYFCKRCIKAVYKKLWYTGATGIEPNFGALPMGSVGTNEDE